MLKESEKNHKSKKKTSILKKLVEKIFQAGKKISSPRKNASKL